VINVTVLINSVLNRRELCKLRHRTILGDYLIYDIDSTVSIYLRILSFLVEYTYARLKLYVKQNGTTYNILIVTKLLPGSSVYQ